MFRSICVLSLLLFAFSPVRAQTITGSITGTITDPASEVGPNATVTAKNVSTNITTEAKTNAAGVYNLLFLPVGVYTISVQAPGFKTASVAPFPLSVNQTARVDLTLEV